MELLRQIRDNMLWIEGGKPGFSETITKSTSQRNRSSDELLILCVLKTALTASGLYRGRSEWQGVTGE